MILLYVAPQLWFYVQTERTRPGASSIVGDAGFLHYKLSPVCRVPKAAGVQNA